MSFLSFLKENKNTRKIFGKRELKIIEKQLLGINLTQSEKNRLSRDIRKKFEAIKGIAQYSEEFNLKKGSIVKLLVLNDAVESTISIILPVGIAEIAGRVAVNAPPLVFAKYIRLIIAGAGSVVIVTYGRGEPSKFLLSINHLFVAI